MACRRVRPKAELVRVVRRPDGSIAIDADRRASGRGAYVCDETDCRAQAIARGSLARALTSQVPDRVASDLTSQAPYDPAPMAEE